MTRARIFSPRIVVCRKGFGFGEVSQFKKSARHLYQFLIARRVTNRGEVVFLYCAKACLGQPNLFANHRESGFDIAYLHLQHHYSQTESHNMDIFHLMRCRRPKREIPGYNCILDKDSSSRCSWSSPLLSVPVVNISSILVYCRIGLVESLNSTIRAKRPESIRFRIVYASHSIRV